MGVVFESASASIAGLTEVIGGPLQVHPQADPTPRSHRGCLVKAQSVTSVPGGHTKPLGGLLTPTHSDPSSPHKISYEYESDPPLPVLRTSSCCGVRPKGLRHAGLSTARAIWRTDSGDRAVRKLQ